MELKGEMMKTTKMKILSIATAAVLVPVVLTHYFEAESSRQAAYEAAQARYEIDRHKQSMEDAELDRARCAVDLDPALIEAARLNAMVQTGVGFYDYRQQVNVLERKTKQASDLTRVATACDIGPYAELLAATGLYQSVLAEWESCDDPNECGVDASPWQLADRKADLATDYLQNPDYLFHWKDTPK